MSLTFIRRRERVETQHHEMYFEWRHTRGAGFGFPCDRDGKIVMPEHEAGRENLRKCLDGTYDVKPGVLQSWVKTYWEPAQVRCDCGTTIYLDDALTNECSACGLLCNGSGQRLHPIDQWEPEDRYAVLGPQNVPDDY